MRRSPKRRRSPATTSWLVTPAGLSTTTRPWSTGGLRRASVASPGIRLRCGPRCRCLVAPQEAVDALGRADHLIWAELQHRGLAGMDLATDRGLETDAARAERLEDLRVTFLAGERDERDDG